MERATGRRPVRAVLPVDWTSVTVVAWSGLTSTYAVGMTPE
ncbi:hypothetical protein NKG94_15570 [Micromonospora sp. M12]